MDYSVTSSKFLNFSVPNSQDCLRVWELLQIKYEKAHSAYLENVSSPNDGNRSFIEVFITHISQNLPL